MFPIVVPVRSIEDPEETRRIRRSSRRSRAYSRARIKRLETALVETRNQLAQTQQLLQRALEQLDARGEFAETSLEEMMAQARGVQAAPIPQLVLPKRKLRPRSRRRK